MKRYIRSSEVEEGYTSYDIINRAKELGIDTTLHNYISERNVAGEPKRYRFKAPGDYIAVIYSRMVPWYGHDLNDIIEFGQAYGCDTLDQFFDEFGTSVNAVVAKCLDNPDIDCEECAIYFENLDTGKVLYDETW